MDTARSRCYCCARVIALVALMLTPVIALGEPSSQAGVGEEHRPMNVICPVMPDEVVDPRFTVEHQGMVIGFCCRKCVTRFKADPVAYMGVLATLSAPPGDFSDPLEAPPAASGEDDRERPRAAPGAATPGDSGRREEAADRSRLVEWIGRFHPASTHMPIGLILGAAVAEALVILTRKAHFRHAAAFCLTIGTIAAILTATLGWFNGDFVLRDDDWVRATHRWLGTGAALGSLVVLLLMRGTVRRPESQNMGRVYQAALFCLATLVAVAGFFGGSLVYGLKHYSF